MFKLPEQTRLTRHTCKGLPVLTALRGEPET